MSFSKTLTHWYSIHKRNLPWRDTQNPYHVWLSEIILQQTQVKQGLPYYLRFIDRFTTIEDLAQAHEQEVMKLWQGLGYYSRARNLHYTAKYVVEQLDGQFPIAYDQLIQLKGIGDYTASAIASICGDEACAVVDGNVYRVLARYFGISTPINSTQGIKEFKSVAQELLPKNNVGDYNQAIMEFGAQQCKPKKPDCEVCPLQLSCNAFKHQLINDLPVKINKTKIKKRYFNYLVYVADGRTFLEKRINKKDIWQNLFQFPLIETTKEVSKTSFKTNKAVKDKLNGQYHDLKLFNETSIVHKLSHQHLYTKFWIIKPNVLNNGILISEIENYPVPTLIKNFMDQFDFNTH